MNTDEIYLINNNTLSLIKVNNGLTIILEYNKTFYIKNNLFNILDYNCYLFGSSYKGRVTASSKILYTNRKLPIILENNIPLLLFPTNSINNDNCVFINYNNIIGIIKTKNNTIIKFKNGRIIKYNNSYFIIKNQYLKAANLEKFILNSNKILKMYN